MFGAWWVGGMAVLDRGLQESTQMCTTTEAGLDRWQDFHSSILNFNDILALVIALDLIAEKISTLFVNR